MTTPERTDDADLCDDEPLLRRVLDRPAEWFTWEDGELRVSSAAFKDGIRELSVDVASLTTTEKALSASETDGLVSILAGVPRQLDHVVSKTLGPHDPPEPEHRVICPESSVSTNQYKKAAKAMAMAASWIVFPESARDTA